MIPFKTLDQILEEHHIVPFTAKDRETIISALEEASEQAFNASRAMPQWKSRSGTQIIIDEPQEKYIYKRFIDFKLDKL